jgi:peptidoglycan/LPS O-acetylase OafA/YrhL
VQKARDQSPGRLGLLEGLRAYLSLWVVLDHSLEHSGYDDRESSLALALLRGGEYAVDWFVILSGFVIALLLDQRQESYRRFIVRRFFRLYPLALAAFLAAVPLSRLRLWNVLHAGSLLSTEHIGDAVARIGAWWQHWPLNVLLHATMLHGLVPDALVPHASEAFLDPGWSISLEWQFYLLAPFCYLLITRSLRTRVLLCLAVLGLVAVRSRLPQVEYGAAWPFHAEFFFVGAVSYFVYKQLGACAPNGSPVVTLCSVSFLALIAGRPLSLISVCGWLVTLSLLCAPDRDPTARLFAAPFMHPQAQWLGRISYGIYLVHMPVLIVAQAALLRFVPGLSRPQHCLSLLALTIVGTLPLAALLYATLELPFMRWAAARARDTRSPRPDGSTQSVPVEAN